ncbi:MAG: Crp/Fnr family transcriptional regulator [Burkholderiales bacterium]|nr:Crp/Fnr family transcriptional regulator [Burkholderiales bacterium]
MIEPHSVDVPRHLASLPLFSDLSTPEIARIADGCHVRRYERGEVIFRLGEPCDAFKVVLVGQVKLFALSPSGAEKVIELIGPGGSFAEALIFLGLPCRVNAQALADTLLLSVHRETVMDELRRDWRFAARMLAGLSRRLHGLVHDVQTHALQSGLQRVIGYLLRDLTGGDAGGDAGEPAGSEAVTVSLPVSKATVASRLSLTPEYFSRVLRELEDAGLVEVAGRDIRIPDVRRLAAYPG